MRIAGLAMLTLCAPASRGAIFATGEDGAAAPGPAEGASGLTITAPRQPSAWDGRFQAAQVGLLVNSAKAHFDKGEFDSAIENLKRADAAAPFNTIIHTLLASAYLGRGDPVGAVQSARAAVGFDEKNLLAREHLAHALLVADRAEEAVQAYTDLARLDPKLGKAHSGLGAAYYRMGRLPDAETAFKKAIELDPRDSYAFEMLGNLATARQAAREAIPYLQKAVELDPANADALNSLGAALAANGNFEAAEKQFREAVRLRPWFAKANRNLGAMLEQQGRFEEALPILLLALDQDFTSSTAWQHLMRAMIGFLDRSPEVTAKAFALPPDEKASAEQKAEFHYQQALAAAQAGTPMLAARHLLAAITWNNGNPQYFNDFGVIAASGATPQLALPFFRAALFLDPNYTPSAANLANASLSIELANRQRAIAELSNAIAKDPQAAAVSANHFRLATLLAEFNLVSNAVPHFAQAVTLEPNNVPYRLDYCQALYILGQEEEALNQCRDLLKRVPDHPGLMNRMGWLLLHKKDSDLLHRYLARDLLTKANEMVRYLEPNYLRNLAKAHAANGEWRQAAEVGEMAYNRALELGDRRLRDQVKSEWTAYQEQRTPPGLFQPVVHAPATADPAPAAATPPSS
jgi:tetratricopeptide (TPR) repeat protein